MPSSPPEQALEASPLRVLLVAHTHWDREWYHQAARFRQRLVALVDTLLHDPGEKGPFLLDGQAITLVDYLLVRPEHEGAVRDALRRGALEAGPWYVLADNLIPGGEALLRNLEAGRRVLDRFGATAPPVAYCPDSFGHPGALPAIATGYGLALAVVWRGVGGAGHPRADTLWWEGTGGARVLVHHLPPDGYETGSALPATPSVASRRWAALAATLDARNVTGAVLLTSGADHHARQPDLDVALDVARDTVPAHLSIERTSLTTAARHIVHAAMASEAAGRHLPMVSGELRDSYGYTWALQGTFGTRAHQKRTNARLERALLRDVEPWIVLARLHGAADDAARDGRITSRQLPALLAHAWETLLSTHPHDTLCGCSVDEVSDAMEAAQASVHTQVSGLRSAALEHALQHDVVAARGLAPTGTRVVVRNRCSYPRGGVAEIRIDDTVGDVPVGPGSGSTLPVQAGDGVQQPRGVMTQAGTVRLAHRRRESPQHYPDDDVVRERRIVAWIPPVPAFGVRVLDTALTEDTLPAPPQRVDLRSRGETIVLSNGMLALTVSRDGVTVRQGAREVRDVLALETVRDAGDSYTPSLQGSPHPLVLRRIRIGAPGPLRGSVVLDWSYRDDARVDTPSDLSRHAPTATKRSRRARVDVRTTLILDADAPHLRCDVVVRNRTRDHRLQLVWRTDVGNHAAVHADAALGHVVRLPIEAPEHTAETPPATMPLHRWVACADAVRGATMISDGLTEAEARGSRLALTLVRSIGELSRADLPERPGHAGWPASIPAAQCQGVYRARVGLLLHDAWTDETMTRIERASDALLLPLTGESWRDLGVVIDRLAGPELVGEGLCASAVTVSRDGHAVLLRARNLLDRPASGAWMLPAFASWRVTECRLDETPTGDARVCTSRVEFSVPSLGLSTLRIERADD